MIGSIQSVANTIQTIEGYYPGSLAYRNNNPGNLVFANQPGATQNGAFASFSSYDQGYQALQRQIQLDANRGLTIQQFINKYAPASDGNDPTSYAAQIAAAEGLSVNDPLSMAISGSSSASSDSAIQAMDTGSGITNLLSSVDSSTYMYIALGMLGVVILARVL